MPHMPIFIKCLFGHQRFDHDASECPEKIKVAKSTETMYVHGCTQTGRCVKCGMILENNDA